MGIRVDSKLNIVVDVPTREVECSVLSIDTNMLTKGTHVDSTFILYHHVLLTMYIKYQAMVPRIIYLDIRCYLSCPHHVIHS